MTNKFTACVSQFAEELCSLSFQLVSVKGDDTIELPEVYRSDAIAITFRKS